MKYMLPLIDVLAITTAPALQVATPLRAPREIDLRFVWAGAAERADARALRVSEAASDSASSSSAVIGGAPMLSRCLQGDPAAVRALVDELTPVIQARAARAIFRRHAHRRQRRDLEQEVEELTQEVFASLFARDAATLRSWNPDRGLSLRGFVTLVADREIANILQSGRRRPWSEVKTVEEDVADHAGTTGSPETPIAAREIVARLLEKLRAELSPQGYRLFELLLLDERSVDEVCAEMGLSRDAVYAWRSRLPKIVRRCADEILT